MGPRQSSEGKSKQQQFLSNYDIIQQIATQNIRFLEHKQTKIQYLLRQLSYNAKPEYLKAIETIKTKKQQLKNADHVIPIVEYFQKQEDQYCSTFYKIYVLFQYPQRTLDDQINERNLRKNTFSQTQLWSILASCILGLSHLQKKGIRHGSLKSSMIFLSKEGHIKVSDPFTTGCQQNYESLLNKRSTRHIYLSPQQCEALQSQVISPTNINQYKSDIFTLGMIILQCGLLQYQDQCYRDQYSRIHYETLEYNKNRFRRIYSQQLGNMLDYMLGVEVNSRPEWVQLQNYVITDNMGKSFISQGRRSVIVSYSKPVSVNVNSKFNSTIENVHNANNLSYKHNSGMVSNVGGVQKSGNEDKSIKNNTFIINKGIGISSSKPGSVQKNYNIAGQTSIQTLRHQLAGNQYIRPLNTNHIIDQISLNSKPKSVVNNYHAYSNANISNINNPSYQMHLQNLTSNISNLPASISHLPNFSKPYFTQSPIKNQILTKNYDIQPASVSNISNTRPLRSIFPNPCYETKTKVDQNLVQLDQDQQQTNRTISDTSRYTNSHNLANQSQSHNYNEYHAGYSNHKTNQLYSYNMPNSIGIHNLETGKPTINYQDQKFNLNGQSDFSLLNNAKLASQLLGKNPPGHLNFTPSTNLYQQPVNNFGQRRYQNNPKNYQFMKGQHQSTEVIQGQFVMETFKLGSRYQGYKLNGMRHGPGKFYYQDGGMYDGNWVKNKMQGYGKLYYQSGKIAYDGQWVQDQFTGHGILYNQNPDPLNQPFDYQNFDNVQQLWTKYQGQFCQDSKNGKGVLFLSNGQYFEGNFVNDTAQGQGIYVTMSGNKVRGIWQNNIMIKQY